MKIIDFSKNRRTASVQRRTNTDAAAASNALDEFGDIEMAVRSLRDEAGFCEGFHQLDQKLDFLLDRIEEVYDKTDDIFQSIW